MRLIDLGALYLLGGVALLFVVARRGRLGVVDGALVVVLWPLYAPALLAAAPAREPAGTTAAAAIARERGLLAAALDAVTDPALARVLPTREQVRRLTDHLAGLDRRVAELDAVLARDEFAPARAPATPAAPGTHAMHESVTRLQALRARAADERDELLALCARLRAQLTVLRFAGTAADADGADVGALAGELLARVEGVGAALEPGVQSTR